MRITDMNWMQVETYLQRDDRAVLPLGSTEQHSYLSLCVDCILPERVAVDAAEPLGIPVFPVLSYGVAPNFRAYPGSISLRVETHLAVVRDLLDSMVVRAGGHGCGFRRILIVNGHGGNSAVQQYAQEWAADHPGCKIKFHNWWNAPLTWAKVQEIDPVAAHGSWMENFPGHASPASNCRRPRGRWWTWRSCACSTRLRCAPTWATATTAASTSAPTPTSWRSGRWPSKRRAAC